MNKYFTVFALAWQNELIYRLNFLLWRLRNVFRFLLTFFLWRGIFLSNHLIFGYSQTQMLTYIFLVLAVQTMVLSAPSADNVGAEISTGDLSNYLVKPIGYLKYWFTRDLANKLLNLLLAIFEIIFLWFWLKPQIQIPTDTIIAISFMVSVILAVGINYFLNMATRFTAFWTPENSWPLAFLVLVLIDLLGGGMFPLNILPVWLSTLLQLTPFPYLLYFPVTIFLGKISGFELFRIILQSLVWLVLMYALAKFLWRRGLNNYSSEGR